MSKQVVIKDKVAFVSGANRGIGKAIVEAMFEAGAKKVYASARDTSALADLEEKYQERLVAVELDVTNDDHISKAAEQAQDVEILVNNAGLISLGSFLQGDFEKSMRENLDVNLWGLAKLTEALLKSIQEKEQGAIVNVSSMAGLANMQVIMTYSVSKAAVHSLTQGLRAELADSNILVIGVYPGPIDTDMTAGWEIPKDSPENVAKNVVQGIEAGEEYIFPDELSAQWGELYLKDPRSFETQTNQQ